MASLPEDLLNKMRGLSKAIKERQTAQYGPKAPRYDLSGKHAIVAPGDVVTLRLLPRWDYMTRWNKVDGKFVPNTKYVEDFPFFIASAHWYDSTNDEGKTFRRHDWCLKIFDPDAACPLCEASEALESSADADERKKGADLAAKPEFLFNGIIRVQGPAKNMVYKMTEQGKPDIRIIALQDTLASQYSDIVTGGDNETATEAAYGDVTHVTTGYILKFTRPKAKNERWRLVTLPQPSPLYDKADAAWKGWASLLHNIPDIVKQELRTYEAMYKDFFGEEPEKAEAPAPKAAKPGPKLAPAPKAPQPPPDEEEAPEAGDDTPEPENEIQEPVQEAPEAPEDGDFDLPPDPETPPMPGGATKVAGRKK